MWRPPGRATPDGPPNIARVLDAGATDSVRGVRITDFCDEHKLSPDQRLRLFIQVCQAIQHAHQQGVVHRDVKPSNILVSLNAGVPKVIDFGIAKATQGRLTDQTLFTAFEQFIDTPAYLSPEQALMPSLDIDTRTDIYSLGDLPDDQRRHAEAESQLRSALERRRRLQGDPHKDTLTCTVMLINNLLAAERYGDAERLARDCLNTRERVMPDHVRTFNARSVLGASVLRIVQLYEPTQRPELATEWNKRRVPAPAVKE